MTPLDAMKQALEALETANCNDPDGDDYYLTPIPNLRAAIEQIEKVEPMAVLEEYVKADLDDACLNPRKRMALAAIAKVGAGETAEEAVECQDSKRYRYMRANARFQDRNGPGLYWYLPRGLTGDAGEKLDAAIDSAMQRYKQ